jgi:hypothetical protein
MVRNQKESGKRGEKYLSNLQRYAHLPGDRAILKTTTNGDRRRGFLERVHSGGGKRSSGCRSTGKMGH